MTAVADQQLPSRGLAPTQDSEGRQQPGFGSFRVPSPGAGQPHLPSVPIITTVQRVMQANEADWLHQQLLDLMQLCVAVVDNWKRLGHREGCQCHRCIGTRKMMLKLQWLQSELIESEGTRNVDRTA